MSKKPARILLAALFIAWSFDYLFWGKPLGISFLIFNALTLGLGLVLARGEGMRPAKSSLWLLVPIAFFSIMAFLRAEPMTSFVNRSFSWLLMVILASSFLGGRWREYSLSDYVVRIVKLSLSALTLPLRVTVENEAGERQALKRLLPFLRGIVIAIPVLALFATLLATADPVFYHWLDDFLSFFQIEDLNEVLFRTTYVLILTYLLVGVFLHAFFKSQDEKLVGEDKDKPWLSPFLGFTEAAIVLGAVVVLFAIFVFIQFRYFFGGEVNIVVDGYTYADYARKGFGELAFTAFFSILLFLGLSSVTRRESSQQRKAYSGLGIALMLMVGVMLVSAYQRLALYEGAYGFSRLRSYTHLFIPWLGLLLLAVVALELLQRQRAFALAALLAALGFALSLNLLNVDSFVARQNVQRAFEGEDLDYRYLLSLSEDAIPTLAQFYLDAEAQGQPQDEVARELSFTLTCHSLRREEYAEESSWSSFHLARLQARNAWSSVSERPGLEEIPVRQADKGGGWYLNIELEGKKDEYFCSPYYSAFE